MWKHIYKSMMAGLIALLPIAGMIYIVMSLESLVASSWLPRQSFYFPGLGLIITALIVYLIGLVVSTFIGRFVLKRVDSLIGKMPALGNLYQTFKRVLGYEERENAIFQYVVLVENKDKEGDQLGLVTNEILAEGGERKLVVFVPGSPNPTSGKLLVIEPDSVTRLNVSVNEAIKSLVSIGKSDATMDLLKNSPAK